MSFAVEEVADGQQDFTAGCFLPQGRGRARLALGTCTGDVEVYGYEGGGKGGGGGGGEAVGDLRNFEGVAPCPPELGMHGDVEVNLRVNRAHNLFS